MSNKKDEKTDVTAVSVTPTVEEKPTEVALTIAQYEELMRRLNAVENAKPAEAAPAPALPTGPVVNALGVLQGVINHGNIDKESYKDPTDKLAKERKLRKYEDDYVFEFEVVIKTWTGKDNHQHAAPRFRLYIYRVVRDEDEDETVLGYALVQRADFKNYDYEKFLDWTMTVFKPKSVKPRKTTTERNIGGKIVEFIETEKIDGVSQTLL